MSLEVWRLDDLDNYARGLGYWISHRDNGFLVYRFDEPTGERSLVPHRGRRAAST